jgi:hypothetical protein
MDLFRVVETLEALTTEDMTKVAEDLIDEKCFTVCQVVPS